MDRKQTRPQEQEFAGKVKCVFIDPPYNTGSAFTHYDDGVEHFDLAVANAGSAGDHSAVVVGRWPLDELGIEFFEVPLSKGHWS